MKMIFTTCMALFMWSAASAQSDSAVKKAQILNEVEVRARKPLLEHQIDRSIVNVQAMVSAAGSNTLEVLARIPGISVNQNGEISLNGRAGVLVLIDDKPMYMSAQDLANYLKSLPGNQLDKVELMDNPPAKYDAEGNGVINIRLKRNRDAGLTGSLSAAYSQGTFGRTNNTLNLNYHRKGMNIFANLGYSGERNHQTDIYDRSFFDNANSVTSVVNVYNRQVYAGKNYNLNSGVDLPLSKKTVVSGFLNINGGARHDNFNYNSSSFTPAGAASASSFGSTTGVNDRKQVGTGINVVHRPAKNRELSGEISYLRYRFQGDSDLHSFYRNVDGGLDSADHFRYYLPSHAEIYASKLDYMHEFSDGVRVEAGLKAGLVKNDNINDHFDVRSGTEAKDFSRSNHFRYTENINAAYVSARKMWKRLGVQGGMRVENTNAEGLQFGNEAVAGSGFTKRYTGMFPSLFVSYKLDSNGSRNLSFAFTKRISRPNYQALNPFVFFRDKYSYTTGNPMLDPQYQYRYEIKYQHKRWIWSALSYNRFQNVRFTTTEAVGQLFITQPNNVGRGYMVILNTGIDLRPARWWQFNTTLRIARLGLNGMVYTERLDFSTNVVRLDVMNLFTFAKGFTGELGGYYASRDLSGQTVTSGMYRVNAGLALKFLRDKASVRISGDDIFRSWVYHNRSLSLRNAMFTQVSYSDTQRFRIAVTYRFGKDKFARKRNPAAATEEESQRLDQ